MVDDPQQALNAVRLMQLEERLDELAGRIDNLVDQVAVLNRALKTRIDGETVAGTAGPAAVAEISPGMAEVIKLIQQGQGEQAQQALYELPEDELSSREYSAVPFSTSWPTAL